MINENELKISNKSYTNKDFQTIYPEALDLVKKLTNKWDPSQSNESDPGVILLKLAAFIGDKNNYNIDKNTLETFMPSATQESSMRKLCEMNGYDMRYYRAAETVVSLMYIGDDMQSSTPEITYSLKFPIFTALTDSENQIIYTTTKSFSLQKNIATENIPVIQGKISELTIGDRNLIQLSDLDDNHRLYIPDIQVAENGIFITSIANSEDFWERKGNLNTIEPSRKVFKFSYDSIQKIPYIEFPSDISSLIGEGLYIKYIITDGESGNIKANTLNSFLDITEATIYENITASENKASCSSDSVIIRNLSAASNGKNPETIDEAYNSFKKIVGTFDTLVTCRDYANAIYNTDLVSNVQVSDRRTDINYSNNILTYGANGTYKKTNTNPDDITPFDLCVYALTPVDANTSYDEESYNLSFEPVSSLHFIQTELEDYKTISHDFKSLDSSDIYAFKNYYILNAKISTTYKVNDFEEEEIIRNVKTALIKNFNARNVDYGYEIPYDNILSVIENSDIRIKSVSLAEPELYTKVMLPSGAKSEYGLYEDTDESKKSYLNLLSQNILNGKVSLFDYDSDFNYEFGQTGIERIDKIKKITSEVKINLAEPAQEYTLRENEVIQFLTDNLIDDARYVYGCYYRIEGLSQDAIKANTIYQLGANEVLKFSYEDTNNTRKIDVFTEGTIFQANFDITNTGTDEELTASYKHHATFLGEPYVSMSNAKDELVIKTFATSVIEDSNLPCYWIRKTDNNALFTASDIKADKTAEIILGDGEYFIYSNQTFTELVKLGSGTKLKLDNLEAANLSSWTIAGNLIDIDSINNAGLGAFSQVNWKYKNFSSNNLTISELRILTLAEGDKLEMSSKNLSDGSSDINNSLKSVNISSESPIKINGEDLEVINIANHPWKVRSRLDINASKTLPQALLESQSLLLTLEDDSEVTISGSGDSKEDSEINILFNKTLQLVGGKDIDVSVSYLNGDKRYDVSLIKYTPSNIFYEKSSEDEESNEKVNLNLVRSPDNFIHQAFQNKLDLTLPLDTGDSGTTLIPIYIDLPEGKELTIDANCRLYNSGNDEYTNLSLPSGFYTLEFENDNDNLQLKLSADIGPVTEGEITRDINGSIAIGKISRIKGLNTQFNLSDYSRLSDNTSLEDYLLQLLKDKSMYDGSSLFYYTAPISNADILDEEALNTSEALWNSNNLGNKFTLPQLDFEKSKISVVKSSKL